MSPPYQLVTLVTDGGTPVQLVDQVGAPFPTTGTGALVFANGPTINSPIWTGDLTAENIIITGNATIAGALDVAGVSTLHTLNVTGVSTLTTLDVTGSSTLNTLNVSGASTLNSASITNDLAIGGTITSGVWNGSVIGIAYGGTNSTATPTLGGVPYGTGTAYAFTLAGTAGQFLQSNGAAPPTWTQFTSVAGAPNFYGSFYDSDGDQTAADTTTAYPITIGSTVSSNGVSIVSGTRITFANAGVYTLNPSIMFVNSDAQDHDIDMWFRKNGNDVPNSNSQFTIPGKHSGVNGNSIATSPFVISLSAGDYVEVMWRTNSTTVYIHTYPAGTSPTRPVIPGVILSATSQPQIGLGYAGLTSTTSTTIGAGSKTFTVNLNDLQDAYAVGSRVRVAYPTAPANFMEGVITAYGGTSLTVNVDSTGGSGTYASWNFSIAGIQGNAGLTIGTTTVSGGTSGRILYDNAGVVGEYDAQNAAVFISADYVVNDLAAIKALVAPYPAAVMNKYRSAAGDQGGGVWVFRTGDQSANITADPQSGVWVAPNSDSTGASGAWQRQLDDQLCVEWFGVVVGTSTDQSAAFQAAINSAETLKLKLVLPAGYIRLDNTIYVGRTNPVWIEGQQSHRFIGFTGNNIDAVTVLYFENLSSSAVAVDVGSSVATQSRDGVTLYNLVVARSTVSTAGSGDTGVMFRGVTNPAMTNMLVYGFDTNIHFNENGDGSRATAYGNFTNVASMWAGTYAGLATCMVDCRFDHCHFGGGTYGLRIQPPVIGSIWSNGNYFHSCTFVGSQGTVPTNNVLVEVGYWHTFHACDFEGATAENMKVDVSVANGLTAGAYNVVVHDGWYSNAVASNTGNLCVVSGNILINGGRFASVSTATQALIRFASSTLNGLTQFASTLSNITSIYRAIAAVSVVNYRNLKVQNSHFYDGSAGGNLPAFIIDTGVARSHFTNNSLVTTHTVGYTNASTTGGNRLVSNVVSATNNPVDSFEVQTVGAPALSVLSTTPRIQLHGTTQAAGATLSSKYSADANGGFDYFFKSRRADASDARSAALSGDTIRLRRHVMDDGSTDVEIVRETTSVDGTNGGAWEVYTKGDGGSLTRRIRVWQSGLSDLSSLGRGAPVTKTGDFTLAATENWVINNKSGSTCTVTLPAASSWTGREIMFQNYQAQPVVSSSSNVVPLGGGATGATILDGTPGGWATLVSNGTNWVVTNSGTGVGISSVEYVVNDLAAIKTITAPYPGSVENKYRATAGDQGGGVWVFRTGNQSANVTADPQSGVWAAPNSDSTGASGAWQRQYNGTVIPQWFGAFGDGSDQNVALQAWANRYKLGESLYAPPGTYGTTVEIVVMPYASAPTATTQNPRPSIQFNRKAVFKALGSISSIMTFGSVAADYTGCFFDGLLEGGTFDANFLASNCVTAPFVRRFRIDSSDLRNALSKYIQIGSSASPAASFEGNVTNVQISRDIIPVAISGITKANPGVITFSSAHGFTTGDVICLVSIVGMTELNNTYATATVISPTQVSINVDTSGYTAYVSGGTATKTVGGTGITGIYFENCTDNRANNCMVTGVEIGVTGTNGALSIYDAVLFQIHVWNYLQNGRILYGFSVGGNCTLSGCQVDGPFSYAYQWKALGNKAYGCGVAYTPTSYGGRDNVDYTDKIETGGGVVHFGPRWVAQDPAARLAGTATGDLSNWAYFNPHFTNIAATVLSADDIRLTNQQVTRARRNYSTGSSAGITETWQSDAGLLQRYITSTAGGGNAVDNWTGAGDRYWSAGNAGAVHRFQYNYLDSLVVGATLQSNVATTLTQALTYGGVTLANSMSGLAGGSLVSSSSPSLTGTISLPSFSVFNSDGRLGLGSSSLTDRMIFMGRPVTGATVMYGIVNGGTVQSDVTGGYVAYTSVSTTQAAAFTLPYIRHYQVSAPASFGAGSTVTNQFGFIVESSFTGATNNYGFYGNIASGSGRYNLYMAGTAANYLGGETTFNAAITYGGVTLANSVTGTGSMVLSAAPTLTGAVTASGTLGVGGAVGGAVFRSTGADAALLGLFSGATRGMRIVASATQVSIEGVDNTGTGSFQPLRLYGTSIALAAATTVSGALTYGGVTLSNSVTGTGSMVLSTSPTLTTPNIGAATGTSTSLTGGDTIYNATAIPAGGTAGSGYKFSSTSNFGVFFGSGAPTLSAAQGSLYLRSDGSPYYNTNGTTGWAQFGSPTANYVESIAAADVQLAVQNTVYNICNTGSIGANGETWLLIATMMVNSSTADYYAPDIYNGTAAVTGSTLTSPAGANTEFVMTRIVTLTGATTFTLRCANLTTGNGYVRGGNTAGYKPSILTAIRIA